METELEIQQEVANFPLGLSETYAHVGPNKIFNILSESASENLLNTTLFRQGSRIMTYLYRNLHNHCNDYITLVIPNLRNLYFNNRRLFDLDDQIKLDLAMDKKLPTFDDISNNPTKNNGSYEYKLKGDITEFDVLHIPVIEYVELINNEFPLEFILSPTNIVITLTYEPSDFWDIEYQKILNKIDLNQCMK